MSYNLHHVKGSRSLDSGSESSSVSNTKITNKKSNSSVSAHAHSHAHNHSHSSSTSIHTSKKNEVIHNSEQDDTSRHASTNLSGHPIFIERRSTTHLLNALRHEGIPEPGRARHWPYLGYMINGFKNLFLTFYFNWSMIFTAPLSSAAFIIVYPTTVSFLVLFEMGLKLFMETWHGAEVVRYIALKYGEGFGAINWGAPELLLSDSSAQLVKKTLHLLGKPAPKLNVSGCRKRTFDLSIAQAFVLVSSLIYERDSRKVKEAYDMYNSFKAACKKEAVVDENAEHVIESKMKELLWESEYRIRQIAESWNLHFAGVSELKSLGGPFCGIFWSETTPFIIVTFKGTTPTNYEEFLVDATFQRTDARSFLDGCVHEGFYESLFSTSGFGNQDIRDPYGAILSAVQTKAAQIQEQLNTTEPVQLWITGHSLGAALSSLLFARWLKSPEDLGDKIVLRDAYIIGTPAVGDSDFASTFASYSNLPVTRSSTLWRIINKSDIFCRLPPGYDSKTCGHYMSESDFFNYSHVGHAIQITREWHSKPLKCYPSSYQPPTQVNIVTNSGTSNETHALEKHKRMLASPSPVEKVNLPRWAHMFMSKPWLTRYLPSGNPIYFIEKFYPFFLKDHIPSQYFHGLQRARTYYENEEAKLLNKRNQIVTDSLALH